MECLRLIWATVIVLSFSGMISAKDCLYDGKVYAHKSYWMPHDCSKLYFCGNGHSQVYKEEWGCPSNSHCVGGECKCDAKFDVKSRNQLGWVMRCKRVVFTCEHNRVTYQHDTAFLTQDCRKRLYCSSGRLHEFNSNYKCFQNSHCENGKCVCDKGFKEVVTDKYTYCERSNFDCKYGGITIKERSYLVTDSCSKMLSCFYAKLTVKAYSCNTNMHCQNNVCVCDAKYRPNSIRSDGLVLGCTRSDFSCQQDGRRREEGTYWLNERCTESYRCFRGNVLKNAYECPRLSYCENRMCYCDEGFEVAGMLSTGQLYSCRRQTYDVDCSTYFYEVFGLCLRKQSGLKDHVQNQDICKFYEGQLLVADRFHLRFKQLSSLMSYEGKTLFIGSSPIFDDISKIPLVDKTRKDREFIANMMATHGVSDQEAVAAFRRFSPKATAADLNAASPLKGLCLVYDFTKSNFGPNLISCHEKIGGICHEEVTVPDKKTEPTDWYDLDKNTDKGNEESPNAVAEAYKKGILPNARLCRNPVGMECREVGTTKMYSKSNTHGYVLRKACEGRTFECRNEDQSNGRKCPNIEFRLICNVDPSSDCAVDETRKHCESKGKECVMGLYGAGCIKRRSRRTGYERIGITKCIVDNLKYNVYSCSVQGPRFSTFDSKKYDFHGKCSYTLVSTKPDYKPTGIFPSFSLVKNNVVDPDGDKHVVAFDLTINSVTYSFNGDTFYIRTSKTVQAYPIGFSDDNILITGQSAGKYIKYRIDTTFCIIINFDRENGIQISLPHSYKIRVVGMCGNFDGKDDNDIRLPYEIDNTSPEILGDYYLVGGGGENGKCVDGMVVPPQCKQSDIEIYKRKRHCGIIDTTKTTPLVSAILDLSKEQVKEYNRAQLNKIYRDCIRASCMEKGRRCRRLEEIIGDLVVNMNLDDPKFDSEWREYVKCDNVTSSICDNIRHTEFQEKYKPNCQDSCFARDRSAQCEDEVERPGCACKGGYFLDAKLNCVPEKACKKTCTIEHNGATMELNDGNTFVIEPCAKVVICEKGKPVESTFGPCHEHAECINYGRQCACLEGYAGDGVKCKPEKTCREGFYPVGNTCYKFIFSKSDWHTAAISCGVDGSHLARYDSPSDHDVTPLVHKLPLLYLQAMASKVRRRCYSGRSCIAARNAYITSVELAYQHEKADCEGKFRISEDRKFVIVTGKCKARFIIGYVDYNYAKSLKAKDFAIWFAGNTYVLGQWNEAAKPYFQVVAPKYVDPVSFGNEIGCYQGSLDDKGTLVVKPVSNCDLLRVALCEYDNSKENPYDPNDFIGIDKAVIYNNAVKLCKAKNRPLATIINAFQLEKIKGILSSLGGNGWLGARYSKAAGQFSWPGNQPIIYDRWAMSEPDNFEEKSNLKQLCVSMAKRTGRWSSSQCSRKFYPICGPPEENKPSEYTSYFPVTKPSSLKKLRNKIRKSAVKDFICPQPLGIECSARAISNGDWVTNNEDKSGSVKCELNDFSCEDKGTLDCSTFRVKFQCPADINHCQSLKGMGVTPCDQQRICVPVRNHYYCRCPRGRKWNTYSKKCTKPCGECIARGDPHYIALSGQSYDFQGQCKYKFSGICEDDRDGSSPAFDVFTQNYACGRKGAACVKSIEILLYNMPVKRDKVQEKVNYKISVPGGSNDYKVNGVTYRKDQYSVPPAFYLVRRKDYFYLESGILDITVLFSGHAIKLTVPEKFKHKMCGLCGTCDTDELKLRNGTVITLEKNKKGKVKSASILPFANDWLVPDPSTDLAQCKDVDTEDCADEKAVELAKPDKCGIFKKDSGSSLKACFNVVNPANFFDDCIFDACREQNPQKAICDMAKSYAQACIQKGVTLDWRNDKFCPFNCPSGMEYSADATCAPTCGQSAAARQQCDEDPEEGCVCAKGKMRLGDKCVEPKKCGCELVLNDGAIQWLLHPEESLLMPDCQTRVTCELNEKGIPIPVSKPFDMDAYAICIPDVPPKVKCRKGYTLTLNDDGAICTEDPDSCTGDYEDKGGLCVDPQPEERIWRLAIETCNENDGTLVRVKNEGDLEEIEKLMKENKFDSAFISGQVKVAYKGSKITFKPVLIDEQKDKIEYYNFDFDNFLLPLIKLSKKVDKSKVKNGDVFALMIVLGKGDKLFVRAVPRDTASNFICEERKPKDNETEWSEYCNTDSFMADDGDRETRMSLMLDPDCHICSKPKDVRCKAVDSSKGTVTGTCKITNSGTLYYCDEGSNCIDNKVSVKCTKDVDECKKGLDDCTDRMVCTNTIGAYTCRCGEKYPNMVDGKCESEMTCTMTGPANPNAYVYDIENFGKKPFLFDYDCPFMMASVCEDNYDKSVPFVAFYVMSTRKSGVLKTHFAGAIFEPKSKEAIVWSLTPEMLIKGTIKIGPDTDSMVEVSVGFSVHSVLTQISFFYPFGIVIKHINNYFRLIISLPSLIQVSFSEGYKDKMCGLCSMEPTQIGKPILLTSEQEKEISLPNTKSCSKRGPFDNTTITTTPSFTVAPITTITTPVTKPGDLTSTTTAGPSFPYCNKDLLEICEQLSHLCGTSKVECNKILCSGSMKVCEYLSSGNFDSCVMDSSMTVFTDTVVKCDEECGVNMKFRYAIRYNQPSCSLPYGMVDESFTSGYGFTCVCEDDYLLSGNKCVKEHDCGCTLNSGIYRRRGAIWRSADCKIIYTCVGYGRIVIDRRPCGPNTLCVLADDVGFTCKCKEGYLGDANMRSGCKKGEEDDGTKLCTTFEQDDGSFEKKCICKMGYRSNCESCEDIDECREGLHDCDKRTEKCINKPGSYECDCAKGFEAVDNVCTDIDECEDKLATCKKNEGCINDIGGYRCDCCVGYRHNPENDVCEPDNEALAKLPADVGCCVECPDAYLCDESENNPVPFCYTNDDGTKEQFKSFKAMYQSLCINKKPLNQSQITRGSCPSGPSNPNDNSTNPGGNPNGKLPKSCDSKELCSVFPPPPPELKNGSVCGPSNMQNPKTFPSYCEMLKAVCKGVGGAHNVPRQSPIEAKKGECPGTPGGGGPGPDPNKPLSPPLFTDWNPFGPCVPDYKAKCGQGKQVRDRDVVPYDDLRPIRKVAAYETKEERVCFVPCDPKDPDGKPDLCPDIGVCDELDPVCGYIGAGIAQTFNSECELNVTACKQSQKPVTVNKGECDPDKNNKKRKCAEGPILRGEKYDKRDGTLHCVGMLKTIGMCKKLFCDGRLDHCCKAKEVEEIPVDIKCYDTGANYQLVKTVPHVYYSALSCHCDTKSEDEDEGTSK